MTWTNGTKPSSSYTNGTKPSSSYSNDTRPVNYSFLLLEDGGYLLQENGDQIILTESYLGSYTNGTKP
jgi:hypothetical protein